MSQLSIRGITPGMALGEALLLVGDLEVETSSSAGDVTVRSNGEVDLWTLPSGDGHIVIRVTGPVLEKNGSVVAHLSTSAEEIQRIWGRPKRDDDNPRAFWSYSLEDESLFLVVMIDRGVASAYSLGIEASPTIS